MDIEEERLNALYQYNILDTEPEDAFDNLAQLAAQICGTSGAQINFLDKYRQWSKSNVGWGKAEMPRERGFCSHTIQAKNPFMIVKDCLKDERFKDNPLTKGDPPLRFYAGITLKSEDDYPLGALCVFESEPKELTDQQLESLRILANEVETHLKLRFNQDQLKKRLIQENKLNEKIIDSLPINFFMYNENGELIRWNKNLQTTTGYSEGEIKQMEPVEYFDSQDRELILNKIEQVFKGGQTSLEASIINKDGSSSPYIFSASSFELDNESFLIGTGQEISEQKETQQILAQSLKDREVLLAEIHHRVKNNLAVISGMIQLEAYESENPECEKSLMNTMLRTQSMAQVHEIMYQMENFTHVAFNEVIETISENINNTFSSSDSITLNCDLKKIVLNVNQAIPSGLIVNELLTNAWKHAYPEGQRGKITIEMDKNEETLTLRIADDGIGLPENMGPNKSRTLGFTFVNQLCKQLNAELNVNRKGGTEYTIKFKQSDGKGSSSARNIQYE